MNFIREVQIPKGFFSVSPHSDFLILPGFIDFMSDEVVSVSSPFVFLFCIGVGSGSSVALIHEFLSLDLLRRISRRH